MADSDRQTDELGSQNLKEKEKKGKKKTCREDGSFKMKPK